MRKFGEFLGVLIGAMFCLAHYAAAEQYCDVFGYGAVKSSQALEKMPFYKKSKDGTLIPTGAYIVSGDYFIASPRLPGQDDSAYCAAYMPSGKTEEKVTGFFIKNGLSLRHEEYSALFGDWLPQGADKAEGRFIKMFPVKNDTFEGAVMLAEMDKGHEIGRYTVLKTGEKSFIFGDKGEYALQLDSGKALTLSGHGAAHKYYLAPEKPCNVFGYGAAGSYKASDKIQFYRKSEDGTMIPTDSYIVRGDYYIASAQLDDSTYCAAYMPENKEKAIGFFKYTGASVEPTEYAAIFGKWLPQKSGGADEQSLKIAPYEDGSVMLSEMDNGLDINEYRVLKTGKDSFIFGDKGEYAIRPDSGGQITLSEGGADQKYYLAADCADMNDIFMKFPMRDANGDPETYIPAAEQTHSYRAAGKVPFYKACADGLCPTGAYIVKGDYFLAAKQADGTYCAAYIPDGFEPEKYNVKAFGFVKAGNFAETPADDYKGLLKNWGRAEGKWPAAWSVWRALSFWADDYGITGDGIAKWVVNDDGDGPETGDQESPPYYPKNSHLSAIDWFRNHIALKIAPDAFLIYNANQLHYGALKGGKLILDKSDYDGHQDTPQAEGFRGVYSAESGQN